MSTRRFDVAVIGAGANGLVAATVLARAGLGVVVLESATDAGGQGRVVEFAPGFRAAPLGLDPGWLPPPIARALGLESLAIAPDDVPVSVVADTGRFLTLSRDPGRAAQAIAPWSAADAARWPEFTTRLHRLAGFLEALYMMPTPDVDTSTPGDLLALVQLGTKFRALGRTDMIELLRTLPMSVSELLDDWFESAPLKAAVAAGGIQDHQQGPRSGGTGYVLLHYLVGAPRGSIRGRLPWREGPQAFTAAAETAARRAGVMLRMGAAVERIDVRDDAVTGAVLAGGEEIGASAVLSTADPAHTLLDWVDPVWLDPEFRHAVSNIRHRGCTAVVAYALEAPPEFPGLEASGLGGLVLLTPDLVTLEKAADAAKYGAVSEHPHIELTIPTRSWPGLSPANRHVIVVRVQYAPYRLSHGARWDAARSESLAETVTASIEAVSPSFRSRILHRSVWSPLDLANQFGLREGAAAQGELGLDQILFMRPVPGWGRHATPIAGLYLGGAGTHPGPGILGGPGWLAARRMLDDRRRARPRSPEA